MFRRRLSIALGLLAAVAVAEGLGAAAALSVAELQVERGRVASDIRTAFVELSATKQRLRNWVAQRQQGGGGDDVTRDALQLEMRRTLERLDQLSTAAVALDGSALKREEHLRRQDALQVLTSSLAELDVAIRAARPLSPDADAQQAWLALNAVFERSQGRDVRQLIADSLARESDAVIRERSAADASLAWMRGFWLAMAATLAVLAVVAALYFNLALRRPMHLLNEGALALRDGQLQHRIRLEGADEFSAVALSVNAMAAELEQHREREAAQRQRLEAQVDARTLELREALHALSQSDLRRRQLVADVSHELRTPTTVIRGEAEITLRGADRTPEDYKATLHRIVDTSRQLAAVIDDLLATARSDIDALSLIKRPLDLCETARDALLQASALGASRGVTLQAVDKPAGGCTVLGDAQRLRQLLLILLDNAVRYSEPGSEVRMRLRAAERPGAPCCVEVADDGAGIAPSELPQVFERHFRGEQARRLRPEGSGLGLAIAQSLARAHGGWIELSSQPGQGTVARLLLPSAAPETDPLRQA
ncbi:sensor histidine kinase [Sphaerotilus mobilis]|uniref:histidine kinase n=1 Tax=Sphaerotilus mobilis TaxID=47994 RepID=A0A4Q7LK47_9BURK|nr:HAMP domain-containing sensor histidine kinase [Sphaerotilus mobilis]RZS55025.1 signal transduction histidine kinase [Sphaerotilus mobilis]